MRVYLLLSFFIILINQTVYAFESEFVFEANVPITTNTNYNSLVVSSDKDDSQVGLLPLVRAGISFDTINETKTQFLVGIGNLYNDALTSRTYNADLGLLFKCLHSYAGPHLGLMYFDSAKWSRNGDVNFKSTTGFTAGLVAKTELNKYTDMNFGIDYLSAKLKANDNSRSFSTSDNNYDISSILFVVGVSLHY